MTEQEIDLKNEIKKLKCSLGWKHIVGEYKKTLLKIEKQLLEDVNLDLTNINLLKVQRVNMQQFIQRPDVILKQLEGTKENKTTNIDDVYLHEDDEKIED